MESFGPGELLIIALFVTAALVSLRSFFVAAGEWLSERD
ncbi:MAG: hypothetical protein JWM74_5761 [Myxococcaceae bacterium]|nr:hypothetical protein [Myxococcaceae bacterium]